MLLFIKAYYCIVSSFSFKYESLFIFLSYPPVFFFLYFPYEYFFCIASFCFMPPSCIASLSLGPEQPGPRPRPLPGRVMYEWLALTSLQANVIATQCSKACFFWLFLSVPLPYSFSSSSSINHFSLIFLFSHLLFPLLLIHFLILAISFHRSCSF